MPYIIDHLEKEIKTQTSSLTNEMKILKTGEYENIVQGTLMRKGRGVVFKMKESGLELPLRRI